MKRERFIQQILISSGSTLILIPSLLSCEKEKDFSDIIVDLTDPKNSALLNEGGYIYTGGIIVANTGNDEYLALSSTCTHAGCSVTFSLPQKKFPCPCHESEFSSTGSVLQGPASIPLKKYTVTKEENKLIIS